MAVPFAPKPPPPEYVPPRPVKNAVWMDGTWQWVGDRYVWRFGSWVVPPTGARRARWVLVRRPEDGQLFFAPSSWKDAEGNKIEERAWVYALGSAARARARPGASAPLPSDADILVAPPPEEELDE